MTRTRDSQFWTKVDKQRGGCWLWLRATNQYGYGAFRITGTGRNVLAHRHSYTELKGRIPDGKTMDHLCRVRNCVNPDHLEPVTRRENTLRGCGVSARRAKQTECLRGHPLSGDNLYVRPGGRHRECRACAKERRSRFAATTE